MLSKKEIRRILEVNRKKASIAATARKTGHTRATVKKYLNNPGQQKEQHTWCTRSNPFEEFWEEIVDMLKTNPGLESKTIFDHLSEKHPDRFIPGQLRTLQRHVRRYRAMEGEGKEVMFEQRHFPGELCSSDFSHMDELGITIQRQPYSHMIYHFTLTYSNWEWVRICPSESLESLKSGLIGALRQLNGSPKEHLTDSLSAAVHNLKNPGEFKDRYREVLEALGLKPRATQPRSPNENGDIEQRHYRLKQALKQQLMLRGSKEFKSQEDYKRFLHHIVDKLNRPREGKLEEERKHLRTLPNTLLVEYSHKSCRVSPSSTIRISGCNYSVPSRLIGEKVAVRLYDDHLQVWYGKKQIQACPRLRGKGKNHINYRHIIESLKRKPGAFKHYKYHDSLYPTTTFRIAYDHILQSDPLRGHKQYIELLELAASDGQDSVEQAIRYHLADETLTTEKIKKTLERERELPALVVEIAAVDLAPYDQLIQREATC